MKHLSFILILFLISCQAKQPKIVSSKHSILKIVTEHYELFKAENEKAVLIVFPGAGGNAEGARAAFKILASEKAEKISVLFMNFTNRLWIEEPDLLALENSITEAVSKHQISTENVFIGGMSVGGSIAVMLSNYLKITDAEIQPKGTFIVDAPIDLYALLESAAKDTARADFSEERLAEPRWIINYFEKSFGNQDSLLTNIQEVSPFVLKTNNYDNIKGLQNTNLRLYTEPDSIWWQENRQTDFENTNAFIIQQLYALLKANHWQNVELIETQNKGYRLNGDRHPHSWSIVDVDDLIDWMME